MIVMGTLAIQISWAAAIPIIWISFFKIALSKKVGGYIKLAWFALWVCSVFVLPAGIAVAALAVMGKLELGNSGDTVVLLSILPCAGFFSLGALLFFQHKTRNLHDLPKGLYW